MAIGQTVQLTASVLDQNGQPITSANVLWSSSNAAVATVTSQGLVTAVMNGTAQITARTGNASASVTVAVAQSAVRITITPPSAALMAIGQTVQFTATVLDQNRQPVADAQVNWSSSDDNVAAVDATGLVTAVMNGTAQITATAGSASAAATVTVAQSATRITITPPSATLMSIGQTVQLSATVFDQKGQPVTGTSVLWSSNNTAVATVTSQGLVTAVMNGTAQITATAGSASATATVAVAQSAVRITITPPSSTLMSIGETVQITATVLDQNGQPVAGAVVTWQSSDEAVATVNGQGLVTAAMNGTVQITARAGSASAQVEVRVMQTAGSIAITPKMATLMAIGETVQLTASVLDQNGQPITSANVLWSSNNTAVATVTSQGLVTAVMNGTAQITATAGSASATATVTVAQSANRITITPPSSTLMSIGETVQLTATVLDQNGQPVAGAVVTWQSSDEAVATVNGQGLVTAAMNGTVQITARAGSASAQVEVRVMQTAGSIAITPEMATLMAIGETVQLTASVLDQNGQPITSANVLWSSSNAAVATVSAQGLVTAVMNGTAQITATAGSASATGTVTVAQSANRITITPPSSTLMSIGETVQLTATVLDQNGQPLADAQVNWSSSDDNVAAVDATGLVTAVMNGAAQITATAGNASASVTVTVMDTRRDREALIALYHATNGPNWTISSNWLSDQPLGDWYGVSTNVRGEVIRLDLRENLVQGPVPSEIGQLQNLGLLILDSNQLTGNIPPEIWKLQNLTDLSLGNNQLTGSIPADIGKLQNLRSLRLYANQLTGNIPPEIGNLQNLTDMSLGNNQLTGNIPPEIGNLQNLTYLYLYNNQLTGNIPSEIGNLQNLAGLYLGYNQLTGAIPPEIGKLENLIYLSLQENAGLGGALPVEMTRLTQLKRLNLSSTQICAPPTAGFQEWISTIPDKSGIIYCASPERDALIALYNRTDGPNWTMNTNWSSYVPLGEWYGVTTEAEGKVTKLVLADNNLRGSLPRELSNLSNLRTLNLSLNSGLNGPVSHTYVRLGLEELNLEGTQLCVPPDPELQEWLGTIPNRNVAICTETRPDYYPLAALYHSTNGPEWTNNTNWLGDAPLHIWHGVTTNSSGQVTSLDLSENNLHGEIPPDIGQLDHLTRLDLERNQLAGPIPPEIGQLQNLTYLHLGYTGVTGGIPPEIGQLGNLIELLLYNNNLFGPIPPEIGKLHNLWLLNISVNQLSGPIPSEIGKLVNLQEFLGVLNQLSGPIPPEIGELRNLRRIFLWGNRLNGPIPPELGQLQRLDELWISGNRLTGMIPSEIGQLKNLSELELSGNQLIGPIPSEIENLQNLYVLGLSGNQLDGSIPTEIGRLYNLERLDLSTNQLSGSILPEIGNLQNLSELRLGSNQLTGSIPHEIGLLRNLTLLNLVSNNLGGPIPNELGQLNMLEKMQLSFNQLTGNIPITIGNLVSLKTLSLSENTSMSGAIPQTLTRLGLEELLLGGTQLCAPGDPEFQDWLRGVVNSRVARCVPDLGRSTAYLTQATQSLEYPVPLVAGDDALLRVFITSEVDATMPPVRATFYDGASEVYVAEIPGEGSTIPRQIDEGDLTASSNARVPGSVVMPGLEMVIEVDPEGTLDPALGISGRLPRAGRMTVDVRDVPPFDLTLVPLLWTENPDRSVLTLVESLTDESDMFRFTRDLLPVGDFEMNVREPLWVSREPSFSNHVPLANQIVALRAMDGASGHYMGIIDGGGFALTHRVIVSGLNGNTIAHEFGHTMRLPHAPCGGAGGPDPDYPYRDGSIGAWGYDLRDEMLVNPDTPDVMSYCGPPWISDYNFKKAMGYRLSEDQETLVATSYAPSTRSLLLWGGVNENGEIVLEPTFVVDAPPSPLQSDGPYRITGEDQDGHTLFYLSFDMPEIADAEGKAFAFILPVQTDWTAKLQNITLTGPEGISSLDGEDDPSAALLLDPVTGKVRGLLRDWPGAEASARRVLPEPGLEVIISRGVPEAADWDR